VSKELVDAIADMREDDAILMVQEMLDRGEDPNQILEDCRLAMETVGKRFESNEYFLPELILAGEMLSRIAALTKPKLVASAPTQKLGTVVIGTVQGDIHDIGKDIVSFMLDVNGFEVHDLGVDIPAEKFVEAIRQYNPSVVGLSGFLTLAYDSMKATVKAISDAGLRDKVKIMIGGGQINDTIKDYTGADAYGKDAMAAVSLSKKYVGVS
jgi:methanogenic corrinoid protein MtbC1